MTKPAKKKPSHQKPKVTGLKLVPSVTEAVPSEEEIRRRAYEISQRRGGTPGQELEDWVQAERELRAEQGREPGVHSEEVSKAV